MIRRPLILTNNVRVPWAWTYSLFFFLIYNVDGSFDQLLWSFQNATVHTNEKDKDSCRWCNAIGYSFDKIKKKKKKNIKRIYSVVFFRGYDSVYSVLCEHDYCTFNLFIFWILNLIPRIINYGRAHAIDGNMNKFMKTSTVFHSTEKYILEKWKIYETQKQYDELEKMRLSLCCWFWMAIKIDKVFFIHCNT